MASKLKPEVFHTSLELDAEVHNHLLKVSQATGLSLKRLVNVALQRYFNVPISDPHRYKLTPDVVAVSNQITEQKQQNNG